MTENPFIKIYSKLPDKDVLHAIEFPRDYDPLAVEAAKLEFDKRKLKDNDLDEIHIQMHADEMERKQLDKSFKSIGNTLKAALRWIFLRWVIAKKENPRAYYILLLTGILIGIIYFARFRSGVESLRYCLHFDSPCTLNYFLTDNLFFIIQTIGVALLISLRKAAWFVVIYAFSFILPGAAMSLISLINTDANQIFTIYLQNKQTIITVNIVALIIGLSIIIAFSTESVRAQFKISRLSPFIAFIVATIAGLALYWSYSSTNSMILLIIFLVLYLAWFFVITRKLPRREVAVTAAMDHLLFTEDTPLTKIEAGDYDRYDTLYNFLTDARSGKFNKSKRKILLENFWEVCYSKQTATDILDGYMQKYQRDMLEDLCSLNSNYQAIRENVEVFIHYGLAEENFPHRRTGN